MRGDWRKFRALSRAELLILAQALALLPAVKLVLRWSRLENVRAGLGRLIVNWWKSIGDPSGEISPEKLCRMVEIAARRGVVRPTCLQHSLVLWTLLQRNGFDAAIHFGVRKNDQSLEAHAWVEFDGRVLNDPERSGGQYLPFERPVISGQAKIP